MFKFYLVFKVWSLLFDFGGFVFDGCGLQGLFNSDCLRSFLLHDIISLICLCFVGVMVLV